MKKVEILAPAGSVESIYSSFRMGADAVYVGTSQFGARAFAKNPSVEELKEALLYAHLRNKKIYLTVNTLLTDDELENQLFDLIAPLYEMGLDACIVQDVGVLRFLHRNFPDMELHASTQMTLFSGEEANLYKEYGVTRYVPARELTIEEIAEARKQTDLEIEVFVHGALCFCYSGQCLMSEVIGGRSGNRGMCAQPCRFEYQTNRGKEYALNTKDICALIYIPELVEAGIDSFKIEGRMKRPEYSAFMAYLYRKYVDIYQQKGLDYFIELRENPQSELWEDYRNSQDLYNRGGFSDSYLFEKNIEHIMDRTRTGHYGVCVGEVTNISKNGCSFVLTEELHSHDILEFRNNDGTQAYEYTVGNDASKGEEVYTNVLKGSHIYKGQKVYRTKNQYLLDGINDKIQKEQDSIGLQGRFVANYGKSVVLEVEGNGTKIVCTGEEWQVASNRPVTEEDIRSKLDALGNTKYFWEDLNIDLEGEGFTPVSKLKKLRRDAIALWEQSAVKHRERRECVLCERPQEKMTAKRIVSVANLVQLKASLELAHKNWIFHLKLVDMIDDCQEAVQMLKDRMFVISFPSILRNNGKKEWEKKWENSKPIFDVENMIGFVINSQRAWIYAKKIFSDKKWFTAENMYENNHEASIVYQEMGATGHIAKAYGRIEVMKTAGALLADTLRTPKGDEFDVVHHMSFGYHSIYTKRPVTTGKNSEYIELDFTLESAKEVQEVINKWN